VGVGSPFNDKRNYTFQRLNIVKKWALYKIAKEWMNGLAFLKQKSKS